MARNTAGLRRGGPGRPKGKPNRATSEVRDLAGKLLSDPAYRDSLQARLIAGTAQPIEALLWHYRFGKPKDVVELQAPAMLEIPILYTQADILAVRDADEDAGGDLDTDEDD